jgi:hypothetical protein
MSESEEGMRTSKHRVIASAVAAAAIIGPACLFAATPALASTNYCSGDACAKVYAVQKPPISVVGIEAWANDETFKGHFELILPDGSVHNSAGGTWTAGGAGADFSVKLESGDYTVIAWEHVSGSDYRNIGEVQFPA